MKKSVLVAIAFAAMLFGTTVQGWTASLVARIDISRQTMTVSQYGRVIYSWPVSTARKGYITPRGNYRPTRLHRMWYSRKYDMSPMPYSVFFRGGYAIHGTNAVKRLGRRPRMAACACTRRMPRRFYSLVRQVGPGNTRIVVVN